jgi:hypothetical protein
MWQEHWWVILLALLALPVAAVVAFAWWMRQRPGIDLEKGVKCWEVFIKLVSALTVVVSGAMLFGKYIDQQDETRKQKAQQDKHESAFRKAEFLRQKVQFDTERHQRKRLRFDEVKGLAAMLANSNPPDPTAARRFDEMYYASLVGVEQLHGPVEGAMVRFRNKLKGLPGAPDENLEQLSLELSRACEEELKESEAALIDQHRQIADLLTAVKVDEG